MLDTDNKDILTRETPKQQNKSPTEIPFSLDEATYLPPSWEHYLDLLHDLCHHRNVLIAVTAPTGAGKTTLMCQFIENLHNDDLTHSVTHSSALSSNLHICTSAYAQSCQVFAHTDLDKYHLLTVITEGFNLPPAIGVTLDEQLHFQVDALQAYPHPCVLLIDNAENLPVETLSSLLTLISQQSDSNMRFHVMLWGSPQLQTTLSVLSQNEAYSGFILSLPLTPFSLDETKKYIEQQLGTNNFPSSANITPPIVETIYKLSEGIPARINTIAPRLLLASDHQKEENTMNYLEKFRPTQTKLMGGLILLTFVITFSYILSKKKTTPSVIETEVTNAQQEANLKMKETELAIQSQEPQAAPAIDPNVAMLSKPQTKNVNTLSVPPVAPTPSVNTSLPAPILTEPKTEIETPKPIAPPLHYVRTSQEKYLLSIGDNNYAIQLFAAHTLNEVKKIITQHHLNKSARIYRMKHGDTLWYILVYGTYSTYDTAQAQIESEPEALKKLKPRVRSFKKIHQEILSVKN